MAPARFPRNEYSKLQLEASEHNFIMIFNGGGWGDTPLSKTTDFAPILKGIQETLISYGYTVTVTPYVRTLPGLIGRLAGTKEQLNSFKRISQIQIKDLRRLASNFPDKRFILIGFSVGGGLSGITLEHLADLPNICGITVGTPGWYKTFASKRSLVLNNDNLDPLCHGDVMKIARSVIESPLNWIKARRKGHKLSMALAIQIPNHAYSWDSSKVREPIVRFLQTNLNTDW